MTYADIDPIVERAESVEEWRGVAQGANESDAWEAAWEEGVAAERERCAILVENAPSCPCSDAYCSQRSLATRLARLIRGVSLPDSPSVSPFSHMGD